MKYEPALEGLRGVAVLLVVLYHAFPLWFPGGWMGVDIFFVLSGYLITTILTREIEVARRISYRRFYIHRALRLMPAAICLFAFEIIRAVHSPNQTEILQATLVSALYVMNWSRAFNLFPEDILGHMWSLSTEEWFYFLWPCTLMLIVGRRPILWIAALIVAVVLWRCFLVFENASIDRIYNGFDTHSDGLLIGCLLSFLPMHARELLARCGWSAAGLFLIAFFTTSLYAPAMQYLGMTVVAIAAAALIAVSLNSRVFAGLLSIPALTFTGRVSYGWYLWHYPILMIGWIHGLDGAVSRAGLVLFSFCIATGSYFLVEKPFLQMKVRSVRISGN